MLFQSRFPAVKAGAADPELSAGSADLPILVGMLQKTRSLR
jgi:hypothetical protein